MLIYAKIRYKFIFFFGKGHCQTRWISERNGVTYNIVYIIFDGDGQYIDGTQILSFKKNHIYILPANRHYTLKRFPENPLNHIWFHADIFPILELDTIIEFPMADFEYIQCICDSIIYKMNTIPDYISKDCIDGMGFKDDYIYGYPLPKMKEYIIDENKFKTLLSTLNILLQCLISCTLLESSNKIILQNDEYMKIALDFIRNHYKNAIRNRDIADKIGISRIHFLRLFKQKIGITPHKFLVNYRLSMADIFLSQGLPISDVAEYVGMDLKTFRTVYKSNRGYTPSQFKTGI